jgi:predicted CoA-binding protein
MAQVVAVVGASNNRKKFGNKAVRSYIEQGFDVYPVNPGEETIEGLPAYARLRDIPADIDRVVVYVPPETTLKLLDEIADKGTKELYLNPGSEDAAVVEKATALGLEPIVACSIIAIGDNPGNYS